MSTLDDFFRDGSADNGPVCSFCGSIEGELVAGVSDAYGSTHWHHKACKDQDDACKPSSEDIRKTIAEAIARFYQNGLLVIREPCDCGDQIRHNNGGNYHEEIHLVLVRDKQEVFVKYESSCEFETPALLQRVDNWKEIIKRKADWL